MNCEIQPIELQLERNFIIAGGGVSTKKNCLFVIDNLGIGEGAGSVHYGAAPEQIELELAYAADEINRHQTSIAEFIIAKAGSFSSQAICAISTAYSDYLSKKEKIPLYEFYRLRKPDPKQTSITVSIGDFAAINEFVDLGYKSLKIKLDDNKEHGQEIINVINKSTGVSFRVDANESWSPEFAAYFIASVDNSKIELIEQPFSNKDIDAWIAVKELSDIPIFMDESIDTPSDVDRVKEYVDGINIKIQKSGRLENTIATLRRAQECNLKTLLGCMIESSVGISTAFHLSSLADYIDLDGRLLLKGDIFRGLEYRDGFLEIQETKGHGIVFA
ncbi:MAG: hypothetical protein KAR42_10755 [candidate division Zixibacteria bacterium]|nr:hypothetical protein [candidate division Zixibacteria bacterium]